MAIEGEKKTMADEEIMAQDLDEYVQIKQLTETTSIKDTDIFIVDDGTTEEKKVEAGIIKNHVMAQVASEYPNYTEMENAIEAATPKVSKAEGNVIEEKTDGLYVSEDISGTVPSMTQSVYNDIPNKTDGKIREITDAEGFPVPFAILNDELETASNVLSAQKVKSEINTAFSKTAENNIYSVEEIIIGYLILNGVKKPIYRKGIEITNVQSDTEMDLTYLNIDKLLEIGGFLEDSSLIVIIGNLYAGDYSYLGAFYKKTDKHIRFQKGVNVNDTNNGYLILQYTKTTD